MKTLLVLALLLLFAFPVAAQDSTSVKEKTDVTVDKTVDQSVNKNKKNDVFIDKDGDGICDFRVKGMSFEKFQKRNGKRLGSDNGKGKGKN